MSSSSACCISSTRARSCGTCSRSGTCASTGTGGTCARSGTYASTGSGGACSRSSTYASTGTGGACSCSGTYASTGSGSGGSDYIDVFIFDVDADNDDNLCRCISCCCGAYTRGTTAAAR